MDDRDLDLLSLGLMVISVVAIAVALFLYGRTWGWRNINIFSWRIKGDTEWTGKSFEPETVAERLAEVRKDYAGALHSRPHPRRHPDARLNAAGQMIRACGYWQHTQGAETTEEKQT